VSARPRIALCADDYGYKPGISRAIRGLVEARRLTATGAIVTFDEWVRAAQHVEGMRVQADVGLHLNLTDGAPLGPMPGLAPGGRFPDIATLARRALLGRIDPIEIRDETRRQLDAFVAGAGRLPDFLDGHHHAHAMPVVAGAVLDALSTYAGGARIPVRDPGDRLGRIVARGVAVGKAAALSLLSRGLRRVIAARGVPTNDGFSGIYDLTDHTPFGELLPRFLRAPGPRHIVMVHPGASSPEPGDPIPAARAMEAAYLSGPNFEQLAAAVGFVRIVDLAEP
jgi:hypothetical protein